MEYKIKTNYMVDEAKKYFNSQNAEVDHLGDIWINGKKISEDKKQQFYRILI